MQRGGEALLVLEHRPTSACSPHRHTAMVYCGNFCAKPYAVARFASSHYRSYMRVTEKERAELALMSFGFENVGLGAAIENFSQSIKDLLDTGDPVSLQRALAGIEQIKIVCRVVNNFNHTLGILAAKAFLESKYPDLPWEEIELASWHFHLLSADCRTAPTLWKRAADLDGLLGIIERLHGDMGEVTRDVRRWNRGSREAQARTGVVAVRAVQNVASPRSAL